MRCRVFIEKRIKKDFSLVENLKEIFLLLLSNVCIHEKPRGWDALRKWSVDEIKNNFHAWFNRRRSSREISICVALNDFFFLSYRVSILNLYEKTKICLGCDGKKLGDEKKKVYLLFYPRVCGGNFSCFITFSSPSLTNSLEEV